MLRGVRNFRKKIPKNCIFFFPPENGSCTLLIWRSMQEKQRPANTKASAVHFSVNTAI